MSADNRERCSNNGKYASGDPTVFHFKYLRNGDDGLRMLQTWNRVLPS